MTNLLQNYLITEFNLASKRDICVHRTRGTVTIRIDGRFQPIGDIRSLEYAIRQEEYNPVGGVDYPEG